MLLWHRLRSWLRKILPHSHSECEIDAELRFHVDAYADDLIRGGVLAKMLADTVDTVEKHYADFVPAARDAVQSKLDAGIGIEERAKLVGQRGRKVIKFG